MRRQRGRSRIGDFPAALSLDFLNAPDSAASVLTFTRASTATYFDRNGVMQTAAAGVPRFDFDPVTGAAKGLLIEEQRTNLLLNSAALSTQLVTVTAQPYTLSFYGTGSVALSGAATGTLPSAGAYPARATLTVTPTAGALTLTVAGSVQYAQLEAGSFATSWVPSTTAAATRSADVASMLLASIPGWSGAEGTVVVEFSLPSVGFARYAFDISDGTFNNSINVQVSAGNSFAPTVISGGATSAQMLTSGAAAGQVSKIALSWALNDFASSANGSAVSTDTSGAVPIVTTLSIGGRRVDGGLPLNGHIRRLRLFNKRLPDAQLQGLTA